MQVVIEIPDKVYEMVMNTGTYGCYRFNSVKAIKKGIPFDKIRDEIIQVVAEEATEDSRWALGLKYSLKIIDKYKAESEDK